MFNPSCLPIAAPSLTVQEIAVETSGSPNEAASQLVLQSSDKVVRAGAHRPRVHQKSWRGAECRHRPALQRRLARHLTFNDGGRGQKGSSAAIEQVSVWETSVGREREEGSVTLWQFFSYAYYKHQLFSLSFSTLLLLLHIYLTRFACLGFCNRLFTNLSSSQRFEMLTQVLISRDNAI